METGIITFTESGDSYNVNDLPEKVKFMCLINGAVQRLSDINAGFGPKAGYSAQERLDRRQQQWERFTQGHWTLKRKETDKTKSIRESLKRAMEQGLDMDLAAQVICPDLETETVKSIWIGLKATFGDNKQDQE